MPDLNSLDAIYLALGFLVPGLVMVFVRAQFTTGRIPPPKDSLLTYLALSVVYYAFLLPAVGPVLRIEAGYFKALAWLVMVFVGPALLGLLLGLNARHGYARSLFRRLGLATVHVMPTAWDWKLGGADAHWVMVTLKDGTRFSGFFGAVSFASSDPTERDLYIEQVYDVDDENQWTPKPGCSVLIAAGEIQTIEFWPDRKET
jgi:hypothetical protein